MDLDNPGIGLGKAWISALCKNLWTGCAIGGFAYRVRRIWISDNPWSAKHGCSCGLTHTIYKSIEEAYTRIDLQVLWRD